MSETPVLRDDNGLPVRVGRTQTGALGINVTSGLRSILVCLSGERLDAFLEALPQAGALDPAKRPAAPDEPVSPSCNYEVVQDTRGNWVDVGADLGQVELDGHKLPLAAAIELQEGLAGAIRHCEWWLAENGGDDA